jgi:hypothetical protein
MNKDGYSVGTNTELSELSKKLKDTNCNIIEITWIWESSSGYDDMPMKITYDRLTGNLKEIYTRTNVIESYTNITPTCL